MKTAFITGAGRGLGKGFAQVFLGQGFLVFAGVRDIATNTLKKHSNLRVIPLDVTSDDSIENAVKFISKEVDHLDYLINNAGLNKDTATNGHKEIVCELENLDRETLVKMFNVNAISPVMVLKMCLPLIKKAKSFVVNISSNRASYLDVNDNGNYGYRASKTALNMMTASSLFDLPKNVRTFAIHPGSVKTDMNPTGKNSPYEQAEKIIDLTRNWQDAYNGNFLKPDGSIYKR